MPTTIPVDAPAAAPMSLAARFLGIITSPKNTFRSVVAHPRWFGIFALTILMIALASAAPLMTEAGRQAGLEESVGRMQSMGFPVNDEMYARMQQQQRYAPYTTAGAIVVAVPIFAVVLTGILFLVFNAMMGGEATFKQLFAVWVHSGVVSTLGALFGGALNLARGAAGSATNLGVMLPMLPEGSFLSRLLGMVDLFTIWWVIVLSIGLGVLYRRPTQPIAFALFAVYAVIAVLIAGVMSRLRGA